MVKLLHRLKTDGADVRGRAIAFSGEPPGPSLLLPPPNPPPDVSGHVGRAHAAEANTQVELSACRATLAAHPAAVGKYLIHDSEAGERGGQASSNYRNQGGR